MRKFSNWISLYIRVSYCRTGYLDRDDESISRMFLSNFWRQFGIWSSCAHSTAAWHSFWDLSDERYLFRSKSWRSLRRFLLLGFLVFDGVLLAWGWFGSFQDPKNLLNILKKRISEWHSFWNLSCERSCYLFPSKSWRYLCRFLLLGFWCSMVFCQLVLGVGVFRIHFWI